MMDELRELYQEVILDHGKSPRNFRDIEGATGHAHGKNPLCGDQLVVYLKVDDGDVIEDVSFVGKGCAISVASASMMTELVKGKTVEQAHILFDRFHDMCTGDDAAPADASLDPEDLEKLTVLSGVRAFPVRVKCATLAWHTLNAAIEGKEESSSE
jgi:nitrogen fixation protein NifU and related proteins